MRRRAPRERVGDDDLAGPRVAVDEVLARERVERVSRLEAQPGRRLAGYRRIRPVAIGESTEDPSVEDPLGLAEPRQPRFPPPLGRDAGGLECLLHHPAGS
jgi:hypothetical protein